VTTRSRAYTCDRWHAGVEGSNSAGGNECFCCTTQTKASAFGFLHPGIVGSNFAEGMNICV
jgi:hypothetical protein